MSIFKKIFGGSQGSVKKTPIRNQFNGEFTGAHCAIDDKEFHMIRLPLETEAGVSVSSDMNSNIEAFAIDPNSEESKELFTKKAIFNGTVISEIYGAACRMEDQPIIITKKLHEIKAVKTEKYSNNSEAGRNTHVAANNDTLGYGNWGG